MKTNGKSTNSVVLCGGQRGQAAVIVTLVIVALAAMVGVSADLGRLYYAYQRLLTSTQAAALAGASDLSSDTAAGAVAIATSYSAVSGDKNPVAGLSNVAMVTGYPKAVCLGSTTGNGLPICTASLSGDNALAVSESAQMPTTFLRVIGLNSLPLTVTATASARGGYNGPYNVVIVLDTTASMNDDDSDSQCDNTRLSCALSGIRTLLGTLSPCYGGLTSCGSAVSGNVTNPVDEVNLMAFPGLTSSSQAANDYACPASNPSTTSYNNSPVYQIIPFSSDYRSSDTATSLVSTSDLVKAVGGNSSCSSGLAAPGGQGTFYAGAIDAAQAALVANARTNTKNVMIILSDGQANATAAQMTNVTTPYSPKCQCKQAITEAQKATTAGTTVYTVAYGAEATGCSTGSNATDTAANGCANTTLTPCQTMQQMASNSQTFFSDYNASGGSSSCISASRPVTSLNQIFSEIAEDLTVSRLIPNNAN
jgi:hypothetical protein